MVDLECFEVKVYHVVDLKGISNLGLPDGGPESQSNVGLPTSRPRPQNLVPSIKIIWLMCGSSKPIANGILGLPSNRPRIAMFTRSIT